MRALKFPLSDETPWGSDPLWDKEYAEGLIAQWDEGTSQAVFILEKTEVPSGGRVLDLGCSVGRHTLTLAHGGCLVTGIDISHYAIRKAEEIARMKNLAPELIHGDFRAVEFKGPFELVLLLNNTFGLFSEEENLALFGRAAAAVGPGGFLVIHTHNREHIVERMGFQKGLGRNWEELEGKLLSRASSFDLLRSRYNQWSEYMILKTGQKVEEPVHSIRLYSLCELAGRLAGAGFSIAHAFGDYEGSEYTIISEEMVVFAKKEG
ncbi:MAG: class I SAM-dependent methyltransferase [Candidatus Eremiobacteraeota bacterium]|nr:class I SAM-dependent methyltransferase [Candidatus Eremiobacteraeota bacterium]